MIAAGNTGTFTDFEGIMICMAEQRGWEFKFDDQVIPVGVVFNEAMYAPALLQAAQAEMKNRHIPCDLGYSIVGDSNSLFGARVQVESGPDDFLAQTWRLVATTFMVEALPKDRGYVILDDLKYVLGDTFAHYVSDAMPETY